MVVWIEPGMLEPWVFLYNHYAISCLSMENYIELFKTRHLENSCLSGEKLELMYVPGVISFKNQVRN